MRQNYGPSLPCASATEQLVEPVGGMPAMRASTSGGRLPAKAWGFAVVETWPSVAEHEGGTLTAANRSPRQAPTAYLELLASTKKGIQPGYVLGIRESFRKHSGIIVR